MQSECRLEECGAPVSPLSVFQARIERLGYSRWNSMVDLSEKLASRPPSFRNACRERIVTGCGAPREPLYKGVGENDALPGTAILSFSRQSLESVGRCPRLMHALPPIVPVHLRASSIAWEPMLSARVFAPRLDCFTFQVPVCAQELSSAITLLQIAISSLAVSQSPISFILSCAKPSLDDLSLENRRIHCWGC